MEDNERMIFPDKNINITASKSAPPKNRLSFVTNIVNNIGMMKIKIFALIHANTAYPKTKNKVCTSLFFRSCIPVMIKIRRIIKLDVPIIIKSLNTDHDTSNSQRS